MNALFDLELGGFSFKGVKQSTAEMSVLFSLAGSAGDIVLLDTSVPQEYWEYLHSFGLDTADPIYKGSLQDYEAVSWGWDESSRKRLSETGALLRCPDLSIVKKCNSRLFCSEINSQHGSGVPGSVFCHTRKDFFAALDSLSQSYPVVVKPAFGGSGFGFINLASFEQARSASARVDSLIAHGGVVVEPWCDRTCDLSTSVTISPEGIAGSYRHQRFLANRHGAFFAILLSPADPVLDKYIPLMEKHVKPAVDELISAGYFGPAGFDSFVYNDRGGTEKLAPVIEINARFSMSDIAHAVRNRCAPGSYCLLRMISRNRCFLPENYKEFFDVIGEYSFSLSKQSGCILLTPLRTGYGNNLPVEPSRNAFFISAESMEKLFEIDSCIQNLFAERK